MGRKHREKKMSDKEAEENLTAKLVETGYREELKKKVREANRWNLREPIQDENWLSN